MSVSKTTALRLTALVFGLFTGLICVEIAARSTDLEGRWMEDLNSLFELEANSIPESGVTRRAALLGLGFSHGQASPNLPGPLPSLSVQDRALFKRGMLLGAAPRWRSSATEDTPVALVP